MINGDSTIRLKFSQIGSDLEISCDSQIALPIQEGEEVLIRRSDFHLNLIHPKDYSYFNTLSTKLGWSKNCSKICAGHFTVYKTSLYCMKLQLCVYTQEGSMLAQLTISNFAIVRELEIDFQPGMTAITGETGAGKSIAIDALGLCLGNRADGNVVRLGAARADICASRWRTPRPRASGWNRTSWTTATNACCAG